MGPGRLTVHGQGPHGVAETSPQLPQDGQVLGPLDDVEGGDGRVRIARGARGPDPRQRAVPRRGQVPGVGGERTRGGPSKSTKTSSTNAPNQANRPSSSRPNR